MKIQYFNYSNIGALVANQQYPSSCLDCHGETWLFLDQWFTMAYGLPTCPTIPLLPGPPDCRLLDLHPPVSCLTDLHLPNSCLMDPRFSFLHLLFSPFLFKLKTVPLTTSNTTIACDTSTGVSCPFVPARFQHAVFWLSALTVILRHCISHVFT